MIKRKISAILLPFLIAALLLLGILVFEARSSNSVAACIVPTASHATIQSAVDDPTCNMINVDAGIFTENVAISRTVTIAGQGEANTVIDGNSTGSVFAIQTSEAVTLTGLTITNGLAIDGGGIYIISGTVTLDNITLNGNSVSDDGGAIWSNYATLTINNSTISGNSASDDGGGILSGATLILNNSIVSGNSTGFIGSDSSTHNGGGIVNGGIMTISNSTISGNSAGDSGGGIRSSGIATVNNSTISGNSAGISGGGITNIFDGSMTINNSIVSGNLADGFGGGISLSLNGTVTITHSTISSNSSHDGGGVYNDDEVIVIKSTISGNSAGDNGGGIWNNGTVTVNRSTLGGNSATDQGGGIRNYASATIYDSTLNDNLATDGGGIYNSGEKFTMLLQNSTLSGNTADRQGGGILNAGPMTISNSTFIGNEAIDGGGIYHGFDTISLSNSILSNSRTGGDCYGSITSQGYNLDSDGTCNLTATSDLTNTNPLVGPLQDNGGDTLTHALLAGSPAIDAGNCPGIYADQRGFSRPVDSLNVYNVADACDIGAFEYASLSIGKMGPVSAIAGEPITYTLTVANNLTSTLTSVVITDVLPVNANYVSGGSLIGNVVSWSVPGVSAGETISRQFVVTATETITNSDYGVATAENFGSTGSHPVVTLVEFPVTDLAATNSSPMVIGEATMLTATISAGTNVTYAWAFGDGEMGSGPAVMHTYPAAGMYTATVAATNSVSTDTAITMVTIAEADVPIYIPLVIKD